MPPDEELLAAISGAVEAATPEPASTTEEETDDGTGADETAAGDGSDGAAADGGGDDGDATGEGDEDPAKDGANQTAADQARARDEAGRFKKKGDQPAAAAATGKKPAAAPELGPDGKPKPPVAAKAADPVNDPIPDEVKGKTRERITTLVNTAKTLTTERDDARAQNEEFFTLVEATGADPDTFARHVEVLRLMNSTDPLEQRKALTALRTVTDKLAGELGETTPGKDPLEGHQDLLDELEAGDISREKAIELAGARNRDKALQSRQQRNDATTAETTAYATAKAAAVTELNTLGASLKASDPTGYARKAAILLPAVRELVRTLPPARWASAYKTMYAQLQLPPAARGVTVAGRARAPAGTGASQPMRPRQGAAAGGAAAGPKSLEEAVSAGIALASTRK